MLKPNGASAIARIDTGTLTFIAPDGEVAMIKGAKPGPEARFAIKDWDVLRRILARGDIGLGEEFIAGSWTTDNIEKLVSVFLLNLDQLESFSDGNFINRLGFVIHNALVRRNSVAGSSRNIKAHYDVGNDFYRLWLDPSMTYSSALYAGTDELYRAQQNKYERILSKFEKPQSLGAGDRLRLGRLCRTRQPPMAITSRALPSRPPSMTLPAQRLKDSRRHPAGGLPQMQRQLRQYRFDRDVRGGGRALLAAIFRHRRGAAEARRPRGDPDHHHPRRAVRRLSHPVATSSAIMSFPAACCRRWRVSAKKPKGRG